MLVQIRARGRVHNTAPGVMLWHIYSVWPYGATAVLKVKTTYCRVFLHFVLPWGGLWLVLCGQG